MPRPKKIGGPEPKKRSRNGCWPCKARKVKCGEEKPHCLNCERQGEQCDYSIRLNWEGRTKKKEDTPGTPLSFTSDMMDGSVPGASSFAIEFGSTPRSAGANKPTIASLKRSNTALSDSSCDGAQGSRAPKSDFEGSNGAYSERSLSPAEPIGTPMPLSESVARGKISGIRSSPGAPELSMIDPALRPQLASWQNNAAGGLPNINPDTHIAKTFTSFPKAGINIQSGYTSAPQPPNLRRLQSPHQNNSYPSPSNSSLESPGFSGYGSSSKQDPSKPVATARMLPPYPSPYQASSSSLPPALHERTTSSEHRNKRMRLSPSTDSSSPEKQYGTQSYNGDSSSNGYLSPGLPMNRQHSPQQSNQSQGVQWHNLADSPLTPAASSNASDDGQTRLPSQAVSYPSQPSPDLRRLSVNSLLSGPPGGAEDFNTNQRTLCNDTIVTITSSCPSDGTVTYGLDHGFPDLDINKNDDVNAINGVSPTGLDQSTEMIRNHFGGEYYVPIEFGFGLQAKDTAFEKGGYYAKPVPVKIPRSLEPLPTSLLENPMNLLYFHHFLNHTARILVPHDCSENPFKSILPQMAVDNINLLNLLLAYSASHRARLLGQPEPANRIALWVRDVFPTLRHALDDSTEHISNANLATAIMLASLEIISPNTFEVPVPWQIHLNTARRMIIARGGPQSVHRHDKVSYFLSRWFAYLDVLGSLSGGKNDQPLFSGIYWANDDLNDENDFQIDCLLGFTSRCVSILARIAELARYCDNERIDADGNVRAEWKPSLEIVEAAEKLRSNLQDARTHVYKGCNHRGSDTENENGWDSLEMVATNDAFHWAGLVHLHRRVLGKASSEPEVQNAVREIIGALYKVRKGGTAEACLLFPMFTAGCDAQDQGQRDKIMERIKSVEQFGMTQVHKARSLMQRVWHTGKPWETLVTGEFVG